MFCKRPRNHSVGERRNRARPRIGIACGFEKGGYIASCAEISIEPPSDKEEKTNKRVRVIRVVEL